MFEVDTGSLKTMVPRVLEVGNAAGIERDLDRLGFAVVRVLGPRKCARLLAEFRGWMHGLGAKMDGSDRRMWPDQVRGIINAYGIGQAGFMWKARADMNTRRVFAGMWGCGTRELVCSMDGACYMPGAFVPADGRMDLWPHMDQDPCDHVSRCYQGQLNLIDNSPEQGGSGFVVWPGSHKRRGWCAGTIGVSTRNDYFKIEHEGQNGISKEGARRLAVPKGCLVVWNSRCVHCNVGALERGTVDRAVLYVCMVPRAMVPKDVIQKMKEWKAKGSMVTTTHNPVRPRVVENRVKYNMDCLITI